MWFIGLLIGLFLGGITNGAFGALTGALLGTIAGAMLKSAMADPKLSPRALDTRIQALENRIGQLSQVIERLNQRLIKLERTEGTQNTTNPADQSDSSAPTEIRVATSTSPVVEPVTSTEQILAPIEATQTTAGLDRPTASAATALTEIPASLSQAEQPTAQIGKPSQPDTPSFLTKLFSGNILAKIGVVLLFFGVASALKLAVQYGLFPIEVRLLLGGVAAVAMITFGWSRMSRPEHRMFGLALQGGGFAILYLLVHFMLDRYQMIGHTTAFVLFMLLGVGCVLLAAAEDGMSLAVLGISGAFMAPVLASSGSGNHIALFSYYAILNGFILSVNWFKGWRALNVCGFIFTFLVGMVWGTRAYQHEHFFSTEIFLILFFLMYSLAPVVFALFQAPGMKGWTDSAVVFGTPIAAAFSQAFLMRPHEYGLAWSAFIAGIYYLALWRALLTHPDTAMRVMERSHLGIAVALLTLAIPLAFGAQLTSALWALEGAVLVWIGATQKRWLARIFGALLQLVSGLHFWGAWQDGRIAQAIPILNNFYVGAFILAAAGVVSARFLQRESSKTDGADGNQLLSCLLLTWGLMWWFGAGAAEIHQFAERQNKWALLLGFTAGSVLVLELMASALTWSALRAPALFLTITLILTALHQYDRVGHVLEGAMLIVFPLALATHYWVLARHEKEGIGLLPVGRHLLVFWLVILVASRETAWIALSLAPANTLWPLLAWGVVPALFVWLTISAAKKELWPVAARPDNYLHTGLVPVILLAGLWSVYANFAHPGAGFGLPYIPILNPFDLVQIFVLFETLQWTRTFRSGDGRAEFFRRFTYVLGFIWLSAIALRLGHYWADVPFTFRALSRSLFVQSALSLVWTAAAITLMITATRKLDRNRWFAGFALLGLVGAKLLFVDLANVGTVAWTASLIGVSLLVLAASYFSPAPPKPSADTSPG